MTHWSPITVALLGLGLSTQVLAQDAASVELDAIAISSTHQEERADGPVEGYRVTRSATATRTDTPIEDIPQAISVVPKEVLDDLGSSRMERALDFAGGGTRGNNFGGLQVSSYNLRGFNTGEIYRNGFSINRGFISPPDASNLERVEVLKGPASGLFGRGDPSGLMNMVTKRPQEEAFNQLKISAGRWDKYRTALDVNRPLTDDGSLLARVNLAVEDNGSFRDHVENQRQVISPNLLWQINENSSLFIDTEFSRNQIVFDRGILPVNGRLGAIKKSTFLGEPNDGKIDSDSNILHVLFEHALNEDWKLRLAGQYLNGKLSGYTSSTGSISSLDPATGMLNRQYVYRDGFNVQDISTHAELLGHFKFLGWQHEILTGLEYENYHNRYHFRATATLPSYAINIYDPVYGQAKPTLPPKSSSYDREYLENYAVNLADQIYFSDHLSGLFGVRIERFEQTVRSVNGRRKDDRNVVVPRAGLSYKLIPELSVFASVGSSFKPNGTDGSGGMLKPEEGLGYESGIKFELFEGRLGGTLAAFWLEKENVSQTDPTDSTGARRIAVGKERSQGIDLQFSGTIGEAVRIIGAYAWVDAELTKDQQTSSTTTLKKGTRLGNTPRHNGSLLALYEFHDKSHIGANLSYVGERTTSVNGRVKMPSYTRTDLLGSYRVNHSLSLGINLNNLFDKTYYERGFNDYVLPGEPRNLNVSATLNF